MSLRPIDSIITPRLLLRGVDEADLDQLFTINGDPAVTRFLPYSSWQSMADARAWLDRTRSAEATGTARQLVAVARDSGTVIGTVLLFRFEEPSARIELGYVMGRSHWRSGLMREALDATCSFLFTEGAIRRVEAQVNPDNIASNRLLQTLGFVCEGTLRQRWVNQGAAVDTHFYGLLATDWQQRMQDRDATTIAHSAASPVAVMAGNVEPRSKASSYPAPFASMMAGRQKRALGDVFGLKHFGVNLTRLAPGAVSALRHAHARQDEFVFVLQGRPTLQTDEGDTPLEPGACAGFRAATGNGHRLLNQTSEDVVYLEVGDRTADDRVTYPDDDLLAQMIDGRWQFAHRNGTSYD